MVMLALDAYPPFAQANGSSSDLKHAASMAKTTTAPQLWLARVNMYRAMEELPPVADDLQTSEGARNHAKYLAINFGERVRDGSALANNMHTEAASRKYFTRTGLEAAPHCEVDFEIGDHQSEEEAVDLWIEGPLHRMLLLNPNLERMGYGYYCEKSVCVQAVNVIDGVSEKPFDADKQVAIEFPPANSTLSLYDLPNETPSPLTSCSGYTYPVGLPITFQIGFYVGARLSGFAIVRKDQPSSPIEACGYDAYSYRNEARDQMGRVIGGLKAFSGVVVIPRHPLQPGAYHASITVNNNDYGWSFSIAPHENRPADIEPIR